MSRSDSEFRRWLHRIVDDYQPRRDPASVEPLLIASDQLFEMGELFASNLIKALAKRRIAKTCVVVPYEGLYDPWFHSKSIDPLVELYLSPEELLKPSSRIVPLLQDPKVP